MRSMFALLLLASVSAPAFGGQMIEVAQSSPDQTTSDQSAAVVVSQAAMDEAVRHGVLHTTVGGDTMVGVDLIVGIPSGIRVSLFPRIFGVQNVPVSLDLYYGGTATAAGFAEVVGAGLRIHLELAADKIGKNALMLAPGFSVMVGWDDTPTDPGWFDFGPDSTIVYVTAGTDVAWRHQFAKHFGMELGLNVSGAIMASGLDSSGVDSAGRPFVQLSAYIGFHF
ncbi:MAG TPA: hypothetical protein VL588_12490 [Bdellovibrionota bacterium]|jgi:hypothetical protein|nr:hypothetical protein [Bdellovibrionota bacterium]